MNKYKIALWMLRKGDEFTDGNLEIILNSLEEDTLGCVPIAIYGSSNLNAYGLISYSYYSDLSFSLKSVEEVIVPVLNNWDYETNNIYTMPDGNKIYMGCDLVTISVAD